MHSIINMAKLFGLRPIAVTFASHLNIRPCIENKDIIWTVARNDEAFVFGAWLTLDGYLIQRVLSYGQEATWSDVLTKQTPEYIQGAINAISGR